MNEKFLNFAEIIESSIPQAKGLCWDWATLPRLCSLIKISQDKFTLYGCIDSIQTGSSDPLRQPVAYKKTQAELLRDQPQIFAFLQTTFSIKILGYKDQRDLIKYNLPPYPAKLHSFVSYTSAEEASSFFNNPEFLHLFLKQNNEAIDLDELLIVLLENLQNEMKINIAFIQKLCQYRAEIQPIDYKKTKNLLQRIQKIL